MKELLSIQEGLKVPKDKKGHDGKYMYRNCDSILEAVKPLLLKEGCQLVLSDSVTMLGNRFYIVATAILTNTEGDTVECTGLAREGDKLMSMSDSQITGSASSYARKTALSGLFLLDDSRDDPDGLKQLNEHRPMTEDQENVLLDYMEALKESDPDKVKWIGSQLANGLTDVRATSIINRLKEIK
jgi:hypothetical protein